jgi:MYXO-CTERM domain-containing protein
MNRSVALIALAACGGGGDPLEDAADIPTWANASSALGAFETVREPVAVFHGHLAYPDPACPTTLADVVSSTITGGCTDSEGRAWTGTAIVTLDGPTLTVELDGFGHDAFGSAPSSGFVTIEEVGPEEHAFDVDVTSIGGVTTTIVYRGSVVGGFTGPTTWNGSGSVRKSGDFFNSGAISAETIDQVRDDDACPGENLSGTTTMTSAEHVVVITYDGATDCDPDHSARWSRDGEDQGVIANITCSTGGASGFGALVLVVGLLVRRRRVTSS